MTALLSKTKADSSPNSLETAHMFSSTRASSADIPEWWECVQGKVRVIYHTLFVLESLLACIIPARSCFNDLWAPVRPLVWISSLFVAGTPGIQAFAAAIVHAV